MSGYRFARFVARGDTDVIIGKNFAGLFKKGIVYEATEILGVITLREVGQSYAGTVNRYGGTLPDLLSRSPEDLMADGGHLLTVEEYIKQKGI